MMEKYGIIGNSKCMRDLYDIIEKVAPTNTTVLIRGETGTGKELVAMAIHQYSKRRDNQYVIINCPAIPENLLESELFGHERGAFTDAIKLKIGRFELANGGTLVLDEVADLSLHHQIKLLRAIEDKKFTRVGGNEDIYADVRIVAATNRDMEKLIEEGKFREDLYERINVIPIKIPPLRERGEDIPLLLDHFIGRYNSENRVDKSINSEAIKHLKAYYWPGNVRELESVVERVAVLSSEDEITRDDIIKYGSLRNSNGQKRLLESGTNQEISQHDLSKHYTVAELTWITGASHQGIDRVIKVEGLKPICEGRVNKYRLSDFLLYYSSRGKAHTVRNIQEYVTTGKMPCDQARVDDLGPGVKVSTSEAMDISGIPHTTLDNRIKSGSLRHERHPGGPPLILLESVLSIAKPLKRDDAVEKINNYLNELKTTK